MRKRYEMKHSLIAFLLTIVLLSCGVLVQSGDTVAAATTSRGQVLTLEQAKSMGLACSTSYSKIKSKIALSEVKYAQAVKSLQMKKKRLTTFSWSPLLSFHFPEQLTLDQDTEFAVKPVQLSVDISEQKHQLTDEVYEIYKNISKSYVTVYALQESIAYEEKQLSALTDALSKNTARLAAGLANQADVDSIQKSIETLQSKIAEDKRMFELEKGNLGDLINLDVRVGYTFRNPFISNELPRSVLDQLVQYTLDNDQSFYETKMDEQVALLNLNTNYNFMRNHYGGKMSRVDPYINAIKRGDSVDSAAFKNDFGKLIDDVDSPWNGKKRILFIKIPKVWFKGSVDGSRYIENEPYVVYENAMDYASAMKDRKQAQKDIEKQVRGDFETIVSTRNSYLTLEKELKEEDENLTKLLAMNTIGECTFEEYETARKEYEELQMSKVTSLQTYTDLLNAYDRLTCGAVSKYFSTNQLSMDTASSASSYIVSQEDDTSAATYYITPIIEDSMFRFEIHVNEDFETDVTHYEMYVDGTKIGDKTEISKSLKHLALSLDQVSDARVKLYAGDRYVGESSFDPDSYSGELVIPGKFIVEKVSKTRDIATYTTKVTAADLANITFDFDKAEGICYYRIKNADGQYLSGENFIEVKDSFKYLSIVLEGLGDLKMECYNEGKDLLFEASFNTTKKTVYTKDAEVEG